MTLKNKISIIIPVYNEEEVIKDLLENLQEFDGACQVIFVDGGSSDGTRKLIKESYPLYDSPQTGRAAQMNYGAELATGNILFFLHCDSILEKDALEKIDQAIEVGYKVGCFKINFRSDSFLMKLCGLNSNLRVKFRNIAFGDQGIFIKKSYFDHLGGFVDQPLMEDYQLSMDIKKFGERIYQLESVIKTSERRFLKNGRLRTMFRMQRLQHMYRKGVDINLIARMYK